jgi:hypothetical protein
MVIKIEIEVCVRFWRYYNSPRILKYRGTWADYSRNMGRYGKPREKICRRFIGGQQKEARVNTAGRGGWHWSGLQIQGTSPLRC